VACDICGATGTSLNSLRSDYTTAEIQALCPGCEGLVNDKLWKMRRFTDGLATVLIKRFMRQRAQQLQPTAAASRSPGTGVEVFAAISGLLGAVLLAAKGDHAGFGWLAFLASNVAWIAFALIRGHRWLLLQQVGFTATSLLGIWSWLL